MATKRMLIDATHPEETRVVIVSGNQLEDFDVEVESRRQLKGNIYLCKVMRVEPSLQAAFVEFGGNRHGFLPFNEFHPDYYQIPIADREALMAEERAAEGNGESAADDEDAKLGGVETVGGDDSEELEARRPRIQRQKYKIQEVIKRRQILLVQVVKEERGTKGAALTTFLSLAGRYCVLMPNSARGGGVSRRIANGVDRKHLKTILADLPISEGTAVIVRTVGAQRSKAEIRRDFDYLMRLWDGIREQTLQSVAPCLIHEEGNLIKRAVRDLYTKEIDEVLVDGDEGYRIAKDFMKLLIPSHSRRVQPYKNGGTPIFHRYQVESQLESMLGPQVQLSSGGYIVINQTEALVAIDVNSGRATRERHIEETALYTNLEAAVEIARQLRLRDLAGLIVIDFIDMEDGRNRSKVERKLKEALRSGRARIQVGRISPFGLLEMSRQRLRPSIIETSFSACPHCVGTGRIRSTDSSALSLLRAIEEEGMNRRSGEITVTTPTAVALYILNRKRSALAEIERRYNLRVLVEGDESMVPPDHHIQRSQLQTDETPDEAKAGRAEGRETEVEGRETEVEGRETEVENEDGGKRRRRRRSRRRKRPEEGPETPVETAADTPVEEAAGDAAMAVPDEGDVDDGRRRRHGRRGGRKRPRTQTRAAAGPVEVDTVPEATAAGAEDEGGVEHAPIEVSPVHEPAFPPQAADDVIVLQTPPEPSDIEPGPALPGSGPPDDPFLGEDASPASKTDAAPDDRGQAEDDVLVDTSKTTVIQVGEDQVSEAPPRARRGWWQRLSK